MTTLSEYTLTNAFVTDLSLSNVAGNDRPQVSFTMQFGELEVAQTKFDQDFEPAGKIEAGWNVQLGDGSGNPGFGGNNLENDLGIENAEFYLTFNDNGQTSEMLVESIDWSVAMNPSGAKGSELSANDFQLIGLVDVHSPGLFWSAASGHIIDEVSIVRKNYVAKDLIKQYEWTLSDVFVTTYSRFSSEGEQPREQFSLNPGKVQLENKTFLPSKLVSDITWDLTTNTTTGNAGSLGSKLQSNVGEVLSFGTFNEFPNNAISLDSFSWGAFLPAQPPNSSGVRQAGTPTAQDFNAFYSGLPSTSLLESLLLGKPTGDSTSLNSTIPAGGKPQTFAQWEFGEPTLLTSYQFSDSLGSFDAANQVFLQPAEIKQTTSTIENDGQLGAPLSVTWNTADNEVDKQSSFGSVPLDKSADARHVLTLGKENSGQQIEIDGMSWGMFSHVTPASAGGGSLSRVAGFPSDFQISTSLDHTTPGLISALASGKVLDTITIRSEGPLRKDGRETRVYTLSDVFVTSYQTSAFGQQPTVNLSLSPTAIKVAYELLGGNGKIEKYGGALNFGSPPSTTGIANRSVVNTSGTLTVNLLKSFSDVTDPVRNLQFSSQRKLELRVGQHQSNHFIG
ncbi:MAG: type VI secretion system tube protein Hcp [Pirellulaceae bacterium]